MNFKSKIYIRFNTMKIKHPVFTMVALCGFFSSYVFKLDYLVRVSFCWMWGILVSFTVMCFVAPTCYGRMALKHGWTMTTFYCGHFVLHILPLIYVHYHGLTNVKLEHGLVAAFTFLCWCFWAGGWQMNLSNLYVFVFPQTWRAVIFLNAFVQLSTPAWMFLLSHNA